MVHDVPLPAELLDMSSKTRSRRGAVLTIGYGGRTAVEVMERLRQNGVAYLVDVRTAPYSRHQPDFRRDRLRRITADAGMGYLFLGRELGGRSDDPDCYDASGRPLYERFRRKDAFVRGIARLIAAHDQGLRVCLLCAERKPWRCHRARLIGPALLAEGISLRHILPDGGEVEQEAVFARAQGTGSLFATG